MDAEHTTRYISIPNNEKQITNSKIKNIKIFAHPLEAGVELVVRILGVEAGCGLSPEDRVGQAILVGCHALLHTSRLRSSFN
jgi:hypothetical protein